ncbi:MAG: pseudouridine synthase [Methylocella sp.]
MRDDPTKDHPPSDRPSRRPAARPAIKKFGPPGKKPGPGRKKFAPLAADARAAAPAKPLGESGADAPQRIAKVIARAGACSRRDAEVWIGEGRVALNGVVLTNPAVNVTDADEIAIDGAPLAARAKTRLFLFHKPRGLVTTERDPEGRQTIFDYLREHWPDAPRLVSIGRLDINTEGLLLLTNDGGLARMLELPATGWVRRYRVRAKGETDQGVLDRLRNGITVDGIDYAEIEATMDRAQGANCWLTMGLREGKNREIKRVLEHLGLEVNRLIRLSFGPFQLGEVAEGALEEVKTRVLRDQLGPALAEAAGVDFDGAESLSEAPVEVARPRPPRAARDGEAGAHGGEKPRGRPEREERGPGARRPRELLSQAPAPRADARKKPAPGPRKHISALRGEVSEQAGGRKRTLRSETADRSGRTVPVERLVAARPASARKDTRRDRDEAPPASRNARRFEAERRPREDAPERPMRGPGRGAAAEGRPRAPAPRRQEFQEFKGPPASESRGAPRGERREAPGESRREGPRGERAQKRRGPYDAAKDRSRPELRRGKDAGPKRFDEPSRASRAPGGRNEGPKRFGAGPGKPGGPKSAGRSFAGKGERASGPASGFRGKDKAPGGKGRPGGGPGAGPRSRPGGKPGGAPRGAPRGATGATRGGPGGGSTGGPGKGRPRGKS